MVVLVWADETVHFMNDEMVM
jgi:hypothetical protein